MTLRDVAERAGVSISTASLVFSGRGPVAPPTAERVRAAATFLGGAGPDPLASSLRQGRAGAVAVNVEERLRDAGYRVVRVTWADLSRPERLVSRVREQLAP